MAERRKNCKKADVIFTKKHAKFPFLIAAINYTYYTNDFPKG